MVQLLGRAGAWRVVDVYGRHFGGNTPSTSEVTNPSDEVRAADPIPQQVAIAGYRMPHEAMVVFVAIGILAAGWWVTRKAG